MGQLSSILKRFSVSAGVFYTGNLCGVANFESDKAQTGHLHLLKQGRLSVFAPEGKTLRLDQPSLLFFPRPARHRLLAEEADATEILCATIQYGTGSNNPLANALPLMLVLPLAELDGLRMTTDWLFQEAFGEESGRQVMMDRLAEILVIQLLRFVTAQGLARSGMLAGLAHPQLARCLMAMHEHPERSWPLDELAMLAGMSRSKFAETFRSVVGQPPGDYLIEWRVGVAQGLLKKGRAVNLVANEVGYENASALARVFRKKTGKSPLDWVAGVKPNPS